MFKITVLGKSYLSMNRKEDSFRKFLPKQFGVDAKDIKVQYVKNAWDELKNAQYRHGAAHIVLAENGDVELYRTEDRQLLKKLDVLSHSETVKVQLQAIKKVDGDKAK